MRVVLSLLHPFQLKQRLYPLIRRSLSRCPTPLIRHSFRMTPSPQGEGKNRAVFGTGNCSIQDPSTDARDDRKGHAPCDRASRCGDRLLPRLPKNIQKPPQNGCIFRQIWYNNKAKAVAAALFKSAPVSAFELCEDIKTLLWLRCSSCIRCGSDLAISKLNMLLWLSCSSCIRCGSDLAISKLNMLLWLSR